MSNFDHHGHEHELVSTRLHRDSGLSAIIAIHSTTRGPAIGGCRILPYRSEAAAMTDVLRLSRGMTYKTAIADIPYGGGKAVITGDPAVIKTRALLHAMGDFVDSLGGRYITSFDSGTNLDDVRVIGERTAYAAGTLERAGNASSSTANGVFHCLRAAVQMRFGTSDLSGIRVAIQGMGNVGERLARKLAEAGAALIVADVDHARAVAVGTQTGAVVVDPEKILFENVDVLAPCALGAILSEGSISGLKARIVCGGANNQLATPADDARLADAGILYCPDYLANAGGIIDLHHQRSGWSRAAVDTHVARLADTLRDVIARAEVSRGGTSAQADRIAESRFLGKVTR